MSYLITGADGFIGTHFCKALVKRNLKYHSFDSENNGVLEMENFNRFKNKGITVIVHFAAKTFVPGSWEHPDEYLKLNITGTINALEFCRQNKCKLVFISSYMYGAPEYLPIDEKHKENALNPYALSKRLSEELCEFYSANFHVSSIIVRPFNIYGPNQKDEFLIPKILGQLLNEDRVSIMDLAPKRDFLFVDDFIEALLALSNLEIEHEIFNIGYGKSYSVEEIISTTQEILGTHKPVHQKGERRSNEIMDVVADIQKINNLTGWKPKFDLKAGLTECLKVMQNNKS